MKSIILALIAFSIIMSANAQATKNNQKESSSRYHSVNPGKTWLDIEGKPIQAHGFSVFYKDDIYYWYGENKEHTTDGSNVWTYGIRCYTSKDFYNWEDRGYIIPPDTVNPLSPFHPSQKLDRPHIIYNRKTEKYVAWIKVMGERQGMTVLTADNFLGPYTLVREPFEPNGYESGDFDLYVDEHTGKGYIWFERPHWEMICTTLTDDFTGVTEEYSSHFVGRTPPFTREAPTHFMHNGKHYLFTSGTTNYWPNESLVSVFDDYHGDYVDLGNPHPTDTTNTSYCSQITDVIKVPGKKDLYVVVADRWLPEVCGTNIPKVVKDTVEVMFGNMKPKPLMAGEITLKDMREDRRTKGLDVTQNATYVWLPITWENDRPYIYWQDEWKLEDYK